MHIRKLELQERLAGNYFCLHVLKQKPLPYNTPTLIEVGDAEIRVTLFEVYLPMRRESI